MPHCSLASTDLFYQEKGQGEPLLFLNGLSGDHLYWAGQLRAFAKQYRCLAVDNRDVGQSSSAQALYAIADLAADITGLLDQLGLPAAHVVGLSMGGMIAQELALAAPERVKSLCLVSSVARSDVWFQGTLTAFGLIRRQVADTAGFFEAILPWWVSHRFFEQGERVTWMRWLLRQNPHPQQLDGFLRQLGAIGKHDALGRLSAIRCPVLLLVGEDDCIAPPRYSLQLQKEIPHARLIVLPAVGHAPPIEDPAQFNARLTEFLDSQGSKAPPVQRAG